MQQYIARQQPKAERRSFSFVVSFCNVYYYFLPAVLWSIINVVVYSDCNSG